MIVEGIYLFVLMEYALIYKYTSQKSCQQDIRNSLTCHRMRAASPVLTQRGELELGRGPWRREGGLAGPRRPEQQKIESPQLFKSVTYCP